MKFTYVISVVLYYSICNFWSVILIHATFIKGIRDYRQQNRPTWSYYCN